MTKNDFQYRLVVSHLYAQPLRDADGLTRLNEVGVGGVILTEEGIHWVTGCGGTPAEAKENAYIVALEAGMVTLRRSFCWLFGKYKVDCPKWFIESEFQLVVQGELSFDCKFA